MLALMVVGEVALRGVFGGVWKGRSVNYGLIGVIFTQGWRLGSGGGNGKLGSNG